MLELPAINPGSLLQEYYHSINQSDYKFSDNKEQKENYTLVECPFVIQAAISGSWEMFKFFQDTASVNETGHIGLSKKKKNSIISNVFGAACYYGHIDLIKNLLLVYQGM